MKHISKLFVHGLMAILPVTLTVYLLYWLGSSAESLAGGMLKRLLPDRFYVPGMGVALGFMLVLSAGLLLRIWLFRNLFEWGERLLEKLPLIKSIYVSFRDLLHYFDTSKQKDFNQVVMVRVGQGEAQLLGFITRENVSDLAEGMDDGDRVTVYLPMSYQMGGFTVFVPRSAIRPLEMSIEEAMRIAFTAAVATAKKKR